MSFLKEVKLPEGTSAAGKGTFFDSVTLPKDQQRADDLAYFQQESTKLNRESANANSFGSMVKQTLKGSLQTLAGIPKGLVEMVTKPSDEQRAYEARMLPYGTSRANKVLTAPGVAAARIITRVVNPGLMPLANDLAEIRAINEKGGLADQVAAGKIPASVFDDLAVLQKTNTQIVGDVAQAVLSAYGGSQAGIVTNEGRDLLTREALKSGFMSAFPIGLGFGAAQAASSGSKDPLEIAQTVGLSGLGGGVIGAILSGAIPVSKDLLGRVKEAQPAFEAVKRTSTAPVAAVENKPVVRGGFLESVEVPEKGGVARVVDGDPNVSRTSLKIQEQAKKLGIEADFSSVPKIETMNVAEEGARARDLIARDLAEAKRVIADTTNDGVRREAVFRELSKKALDEGDAALVLELAKSKIGTEAAQSLKALDTGYRLDADPIKALQEISTLRQEKALKGQDIKSVIKEEKAKLKPVEKVPPQTWTEFIDELTC